MSIATRRHVFTHVDRFSVGNEASVAGAMDRPALAAGGVDADAGDFQDEHVVAM